MVYIRSEWQKGDAQLIADLHTKGYENLGDRFGKHFEEYVAKTLLDSRLDERMADENDRSRVWFAQKNGETLGCAAIIDHGVQAQLRWVVVLESARGHGLGRDLLDMAVDYAKRSGFEEIYLQTIKGLIPSMSLYEKQGFKTVSEDVRNLWFGEDIEVVMRMHL